MATVGSLIFEMSANVARLQQDMNKARSTVKTATDGIQSAIRTTQAAFQVLGGTLLAHEFVSFIDDGIKAQASLHDLAIQTGLAVETLSALRLVARESGTDLATTGTMVNRLEHNMLTFSQTGKGLMAPAFQQLGYSQAQAAAGLRDMNAFLPEFARRLIAAGAGGEKAGLAMQLMGRGGAVALPFLERLAEQAELAGTETTADANAAHEFEVRLAELKEQSTLLSISLANELIPGLNNFAEAAVKARRDGDGFFTSVWAGLKGAYGGTDLDKANKAMFDQTSQLLSLQKQLSEAAPGSAIQKSLRIAVAHTKDDLALVQAHWDLLTHEQEMQQKASEKPANKPLPSLTGRAGLDEHDLQVYAHAVQAVKELHAEEKNRQKDAAAADKQFVTAMEEFDRYTEANNKALERQAQHWKDIIDPMEPFRRKLAEINNLYEQSKLTSAEWSAATDNVAKKMGNANQIAADKSMNVWKTAAKDMQRSMSSLFFDVETGNLKSLGANFTKYIAKMVADAEAAKVSLALFGPSFSKTGALGGLAGQLMDSFGLGSASNMAYGNTTFAEAAAAGVIPMAAGGDFMVNKPTLFLAGEAGPERASFGGARNPGGTTVVNNFHWTVNALDARSVNQLLGAPATQRMIRGIIEQGYQANGTVSGMAAR